MARSCQRRFHQETGPVFPQPCLHKSTAKPSTSGPTPCLHRDLHFLSAPGGRIIKSPLWSEGLAGNCKWPAGPYKGRRNKRETERKRSGRLQQEEMGDTGVSHLPDFSPLWGLDVRKKEEREVQFQPVRFIKNKPKKTALGTRDQASCFCTSYKVFCRVLGILWNEKHTMVFLRARVQCKVLVAPYQWRGLRNARSCNLSRTGLNNDWEL